MVTKRLSALAGFLLLIGCVVGIVLIMYGGDSTRTSSKSRPKESFRSRESKIDNLGGSILHDSEPSLEEVYQLADDLEKLFSKNSNGDHQVASQHSKNSKPKTKPPEPTHAQHPVGEELDGEPSTHRSSTPTAERNRVTMMETVNRKEIGDEMEGVVRNDFPTTSPWIPSTNPKMYHRKEVQNVAQSNGPLEPTFTIPRETRHGGMDMRVVKNQMVSPSNSASYHRTQHQWQQDEEEDDDDSETSEEEETLDEDQYVSEREDGQPDPVMQLGELFDLATNLYASGANSSSLQGFIRVLNETVNRGNSSGLLAQLNELYSRPESPSSLKSDVLAGRNAYETSLTAFVFMSFGVFLLNQIHGFVGEERSGSQSRKFQADSPEDFDLNVLFEPPNGKWTPAENHSEKNGQSSQSRALHEHLDSLSSPTNNSSGDGTSFDPSDDFSNNNINNSFFSPDYVNNMFRALLNLVNAYSKNPQELECIWSLYCKDLDKTAAKQGLYGIAARINSIGLRLIMEQIPAELTLDVMLRSLLAWDGLPCMKMFPKCQPDNAIVTLHAATSGNNPSLQTT